MKSPLLTPRVLLAAILCIGGGIAASQAGPPKKWEPNHWKVPPQQYDEIVDVSLTANQVTIRHIGGPDKVEHTLKVTAFSDIKVDDKKATIKELKPGMRVTFNLGGDGESLDRLETVQPPPPPPTPVATATPSFPHAGK